VKLICGEEVKDIINPYIKGECEDDKPKINTASGRIFEPHANFSIYLIIHALSIMGSSSKLE